MLLACSRSSNRPYSASIGLTTGMKMSAASFRRGWQRILRLVMSCQDQAGSERSVGPVRGKENAAAFGSSTTVRSVRI